MKLTHTISYCLLMLALGSGCNRKTVPETTLPVRESNSQYTLSYDISNDNRNIYVRVMTKDIDMRKRISKAGMRLYFDPKGREKGKMTLVYPLRNMDGGKIPPVYSTDGFQNMANGEHDLNDSKTGIKVGLVYGEDSSLVYEAIVPIDKVLGQGLTDKAMRKDCSVGIVVNQLPGRHGGGDQGPRRGGGGGMQPRVSVGGGIGSFGMGSGMGMGMSVPIGGMRGGGGPGRGGAGGVQEDVRWVTFRFSAEEKK